MKYIVLITLLLYLNSTAQKSDFIVTTSFDTIYVDKINLTDFKVKTMTSHKKKNYNIDEIISYFDFLENKYFERITNQIEKKEFKESDRYDYKRMENLHIEQYKNSIKYKYIQRLTVGKIKLLVDVIFEDGGAIAGQLGYMPSKKNKTYYIAINDSKLELINNSADFKLFDFNKGLELNNEVYQILKIYLYGNKEINLKLDYLFASKPIAKEIQIIDLINEYNSWAKSNK